MQLIVISNPENLNGEAAVINDLFRAGLSCFHLRKPGSSAGQLGALLDRIDAAFYPRIALHQHHGLARTYGINRLHYTEEARRQTSEDILESNIQQGYLLSTSVHETQHLSSPGPFKYTFFGPVFDSISKPGYRSAVKPGFRIKTAPGKPLVIALGGIEAGHLPAIKEMGFDGAAVLGTIWQQPEKAIEIFTLLQANMPV